MPTSTHLDNLKINVLTESQFDAAVQGGVIGAGEISMITDLDEAIQVSTLPTAAAGEEGKIYQFIGTTDANYTNGYFYKCVSDGQTPATYSWTQTNVQPAGGGGLPSQTGNAGKFLTTNGTDASWTDTMTTSVGFYNGSYYKWRVGQSGHDVFTIEVSPSASSTRRWTALTFNARNVPTSSTGVPQIDVQAPSGGRSTFGWNGNGWKTVVTKNISSTNTGYNNDYLISVPTMTAGAMFVQVSTMPTAGDTYLGRVYQYIGTTDSTYTHGYIYECKAQGTDPETYAWEAVEVQAGGSGLPSQTGNAGKFLTTDGTDASWATVNALQNTATTTTNSLGILGSVRGFGTSNTVVGSSSVAGSETKTYTGMTVIGAGSSANNHRAIVIGNQASCNGQGSIALGRCTISSNNTIGLNATEGAGLAVLNDANSMYVAIKNGVWTKLLSSDETIPADRFTTTPVADGTYVPTLTISSGVATRSWAAPSGGSTALSLTLAAANWSNNTITVTATGVTASNNVIVSPTPASQSAYTTAGVMCTAQGSGTLTFTCTSTPSSDLTVNVLII